MPNIVVRPVVTRREKKRFLQFPWTLYRDDPLWVPPLRGNQKELVGYKRHPFYETAKSQTFLAFRDGEVCGRVAAILNHAHNRLHENDKRGFVGFFESIDDQDVANGLFDAVREWFTERGLFDLRGPVNPSLNYECGLLIKNFEMSPTFMMTYNPAYYPRLWENYGFRHAQDLFSYVASKPHLETMDTKLEFIAKEAIKRFQVNLRTLNRRRFRQDLETFLNIYNVSLDNVWGHVPMSQAEVAHTARAMRFLLVPELTLIAEVEGKPVGCMLALLDYNPRIKQMNGRLFPFGFLKLLFGRRKIHRLRLVSTNVRPEYQLWGVGLILAACMLEPAMKFGMEEGEFSWVLESNQLSRKTLERGNLPVEKVHRIYDYLGSHPSA